MILRFLLILIALVVLLRLLGWTPPGVRRHAAPAEGGGDAPAARVLVACAHCRDHLPQSQAIERQGQWYCSTAHAQAGPRPAGSGERPR